MDDSLSWCAIISHLTSIAASKATNADLWYDIIHICKRTCTVCNISENAPRIHLIIVEDNNNSKIFEIVKKLFEGLLVRRIVYENRNNNRT